MFIVLTTCFDPNNGPPSGHKTYIWGYYTVWFVKWVIKNYNSTRSRWITVWFIKWVITNYNSTRSRWIIVWFIKWVITNYNWTRSPRIIVWFIKWVITNYNSTISLWIIVCYDQFYELHFIVSSNICLVTWRWPIVMAETCRQYNK